MLNKKKRNNNNNNNKSSFSSSCVFIGGMILGMVVGVFIYLQYNDNNDNDTLNIENQYLISSQMDSTLLMTQRQDSKLKAQLHKELERIERSSSKFNKITFIGDSRVRSLYLLFIYAMQRHAENVDINSFINEVVPNVNPERCFRKKRLYRGNDLICNHTESKAGTQQGCHKGNKELPGCYYKCVQDKVTYARDCSFENPTLRVWTGCEERYMVIGGITIEYIYTTSIFWSDPYLSSFLERAQIKKDRKHLHIFQTNLFTYFNGDNYFGQDKNSCSQFFNEINALLQRLEDFPKDSVMLLSNSYYPGFFVKGWSQEREVRFNKYKTNYTNHFKFKDAARGIWKYLEQIAKNKKSTGLYNFKYCAWGEILARESKFKWVDALSPSYVNYNTYDSKHFYPYIYKSQINEILNWIFPGRSSKKLIYTPMKRTKEQEKEYFTGLQSNNRTKNITANNRTRQNLKKKKKNYTHFF